MSLNILSKSNAIGFYTYHQISCIKDLVFKKTEEKCGEISANNLKSDCQKLWDQPTTKTKINLAIKIYNTINILGYLPIIGTIIGVVKLVLLSKAEKQIASVEEGLKTKMDKKPVLKKDVTAFAFPALNDVKSFGIGFKCRAILETTSLGFLLLIPDLIATIHRSTAKKPTVS